ITRRYRRLRLEGAPGGASVTVHIAEMGENLGYAGGVNAWLRPLLTVPGWTGAWILNPDTEPTPTALAELVAYADAHGRGMVGSRLVSSPAAERIFPRGLAWNRLAARTTAVDKRADAAVTPDENQVDARIDSPSGASLYV